jgi:hypothetical protein
MLFDQIDRFLASPFFQAQHPVDRAAGQALAARIAESPRFVLDGEVIDMIHRVQHGKARSLLAALALCRLPYPQVWIEYDHRHRLEWVNELERRGVTVPQPPDGEVATRAGFLMWQPADGEILAHPVWLFPDGRVSWACQAVFIQTGAAFDPLLDGAELKRLYTEASPELRKRALLWPKAPEDVAAAVELDQRAGSLVPDFLEATWREAATIPGLWERMEERDRHNLTGAKAFVVAMLAVINSRNSIKYSEPIGGRPWLNKKRAAKGKPPLKEHRVITLDLSRALQKRMGVGDGAARASPLAHGVRGHLKVRKSGVYWWSSHIRGGTTAEPGTYRVVK